MKRAVYAAMMLLLVGVAAVATAGSDVLLDALLQRPRAASGTVVVPDQFVRSWDPITVFFPTARGPSEAGPEAEPGRYVSMEPAWPGAWTWLDRRTLQFRPAEPYPPLQSFRIDPVGTDREVSLDTLMSPPTRTQPMNGARDLAPVERIQLTFDRPLEPTALARMITIELRPLPGLGDRDVTLLDRRDFEVKLMERSSPDDPVQVALVLRQPIPLGHRATVRFGLSLDDRGEAVSTLVFDTAQPFRIATVGCGGAQVPIGPGGGAFAADNPLSCRSTPEVRIDFTARPAELGPVEGRNLVRFEPAVPELSYRLVNRTLVITGAFQPNQPYRVSVSPTGLLDEAGRTLQLRDEGVVWMYFPPRDPYLRFDLGRGIAERHGPQRVPVEGRGLDRADVRIYRVDPLNRNLWPFPDTPVNVDEAVRPPGPGEESAPHTAGGPISSRTLAVKLSELGSPGISEIVDLESPAGASRFGLDVAPLLTRLSGSGAPGHYLVGLRRLDGGTLRSWVRLQVTDLALSTVESPRDTLFLVSSLASGKGVAGARVTIEGEVHPDRGAPDWSTLFEGRTDGQGVVRWKAPGAPKRGRIVVRRLVVSKGSDALVLQPQTATAFQDGHWHRPRSGWLQWAYQSLDGRGEPERLLGHVFTERPIYRPGEEVHLKGYVRTRAEGRLRLASGEVRFVVTGPDGNEWVLPAEQSAVGSAYARWQLDDPPTGVYRATLQHKRDKRFVALHHTTFQIEAYRLPTFEVLLHPPGGDTVVPNDRPFDVAMTATYYAGGQVAARPVRWRVEQYPYAWTPPTDGLEGFRWSSDARYGHDGGFRATPTLTSEVTTGRDGAATLALDPSIEADARPRTYLVEATVTGADDQTVTESLQVHAVPAFVLGLKVPRHVEDSRLIRGEAVVVGPDGALQADRELTVRVIHRQWHSVLQASDYSSGEAKYVTDVVEVPVSETALRSTSRPQKLELAIPEAGVYVVELESRDATGRGQVVRVDLFASGEEPVAWEKPKAGTFGLTLDRDAYEPGDRAKVLVRSPFPRGEALVVVETPTGNDYRHVAIRGGTATVSIPVAEGWVPRIPVHVLLRRGRTDVESHLGGDGTVDLGKPQTVASTVWLPVTPIENQVQVGLVHPDKALPGQTIEMTVTLRDPSGRPRAGEVTLWLVDQAVLALAKEARLDPLPEFLPDRASFVWLRDSRNLTLGTIPTVPMPGGDGDDWAEESRSAVEQAAVRKDFRPIAYYEPALKVGPSGQATVKIPLPDNLTVFKVRAKAASGAERFGVGTSELRVRLPVVVQPALPRFVRPGDRFDASALVRVVEGSGGAAFAEIRADGMHVKGPNRITLTLDDVEASRAVFPVQVQTPPMKPDGTLERTTATVRLGAVRESDRAADAAETVLPVRDDRRPRVSRQRIILADGAAQEIPALPEEARPGSVRRLVVIADHEGITKLASGLDLLRRGRPRNTGEHLARARVLLALGELREPLGLGSPDESTEVDDALEGAFAWLSTVVDSSGQVAQWPGNPGRISLTAEALALLVEAEAAGRRIDGPLKDTLIRALTAALRSDYGRFIDGERWYERSRALWALTFTGRFEDAYFDELARNVRNLGPDSAAHVLLAAIRGDAGRTPRAAALTNRLSSEITVQLYEGQERYAGLKTRRTDRSPLISSTEARTLARVSRALHAARADDPKIPVAIDALVRLGADDGWGFPEADADALFALEGRLRESPGADGRLEIGDALRVLKPEAPVAQWSTGAAEGFTLTHAGGRPVSVLVVDRWIPAADGSAQAPVQQGFVVSRSWLQINEQGPADRFPLDTAGQEQRVEVGDVIEEHVQFVNPAPRHHVVVEVPLAAGMELLNPSLATAPPEATPSGRTTAQPSWVAYYDDGVTLAFETLPKGTWDLYFRTRASTRGQFVQPPASAEMIYDRTVLGLSAGARVVVR